MQFENRKRLKVEENGKRNQYPFWINFYQTPPDYKISLQDIENMATERLKILQIVENIYQAKLDDSKANEIIVSQIDSLKINNEKNFYTAGRSELTGNSFEARKRDHISHFLLRIFYCQNDQLRQWFINRETKLFKIRFLDANMTPKILKECLTYYGFNFEIVTTDSDLDLYKKIYWNQSVFNNNLRSIAFKLKFEEALDLVRYRKVFVKDGFAYIGGRDMVSVLCNQFRLNLSREMAKMNTDFYMFDEPRLICKLDSLHQYYISNRTKPRAKEELSEQIFPEDIDNLAKEFFPPCMRSIHDSMRKEHHLKHYGRLYYGLFLKSAGLSLEDAIDFFRAEFCINNPDKFQKEYSYTIRYIYGKEGKRVQLSAYSCQKILNENAPGPTDVHGCPFKHYDINNLKARLVSFGINNENDLESIINVITSSKNFNSACTKYFSIKFQRDLPDGFTITHPNQFFQEGRRPKQIPPKIKEENDENKVNNDNENNHHNNGDTVQHSSPIKLSHEDEEELLNDSFVNE